MRLWGRRARRASTNEDRLKRLYVLGKLTLDAFMEQVDAQLEAGTLDAAVLGRDPSLRDPARIRGREVARGCSRSRYVMVYSPRPRHAHRKQRRKEREWLNRSPAN